MTGILMLESLTRGNTLKQGDKTPLTYKLLDADGDNLNVSGKSATVRLVYPNYLTIGYEKSGLLVSQDDTVTFTIDNIIPSRIYNVEIIVDDKFIFPSRSAESKFTVDKSSLGTEASIIEIIGKDTIIRDVRQQVEAGLQPMVDDSTLAEAQRKTAESVRVANEEERISKDSERDSKIEEVEGVVEDVSGKIDTKANKSMLLSPKYDLVYDSCVRDVNTPLDAYSVPMESGHYFENVEDRNSDTTLTYEPDGVLLAIPALRRDFSPVLIEDFDVDFPYFDVRAKSLVPTHDSRTWFIKYKDKDNWVAVMIEGSHQQLTVTSSVEGIATEIASENISSKGERQADPDTIYSLKAYIIGSHKNFAESTRALRVFKNEQWVFNVPIPTNAVSFPNRVGFSVSSPTEILNFKAGRSS